MDDILAKLGLAEWFQNLGAETGWNLTSFFDGGDAARFMNGIWVTIELSALCMVLSLVIGFVAAGVKNSRFKPLVWFFEIYIQFFRNTPSVVQLYFFFFGLGSLIAVTNEYGQSVPLISAFTWTVLCLSIYFGAFNAEIFRAGMDAVPKATVEAATALGYTRFGIYVHVVFPLALRISFPAFGNNMVNLIKSTSIAYAISVPETLYVASQIWADQLNVVEMMNLVLFSYVAIVGAFVFLLGRIERAIRVPGVGI